jgi:hypothetical protein
MLFIVIQRTFDEFKQNFFEGQVFIQNKHERLAIDNTFCLFCLQGAIFYIINIKIKIIQIFISKKKEFV